MVERNDGGLPGVLHDMAVMSGDGRVDEVAAETPQTRESAVLVGAGEPAVADDIRKPESPQVCGSRSSRPSWSRQVSPNANSSLPVFAEKDCSFPAYPAPSPRRPQIRDDRGPRGRPTTQANRSVTQVTAAHDDPCSIAQSS